MSSSVREECEKGAARGGEMAQSLALWSRDVGRAFQGAAVVLWRCLGESHVSRLVQFFTQQAVGPFIGKQVKAAGEAASSPTYGAGPHGATPASSHFGGSL